MAQQGCCAMVKKTKICLSTVSVKCYYFIRSQSACVQAGTRARVHTHRHTHTHSVELPWRSDRYIAQALNLHNTQTSTPPPGLESATPAIQRPQDATP